VSAVISAAEPFEIACADGWRLRGEILVPSAPRAAVIVGHAMMVDRRTLDRPRGDGLVRHLERRGLAVIWPDLRGHGQSGPRAERGGRWGYDDLVEGDVPALIELARGRFPRLPCLVVGHSLFGHVTLAHLARRPDTPLAGLVMIAGNIYHRGWRERPGAYLKKRLLIEAMGVLSRGGAFPARWLGAGTDDEPAGYVADFVRWMRQDQWAARDGFSYEDHLDRVRTPVLGIVGAGDRIYAPPDEVRGLLARVPGARVEVVGVQTGLPVDPGHMGIVIDPRARPVWDRVADFLLALA
jgi:predicted alpha/beta hydrolase